MMADHTRTEDEIKQAEQYQANRRDAAPPKQYHGKSRFAALTFDAGDWPTRARTFRPPILPEMIKGSLCS